MRYLPIALALLLLASPATAESRNEHCQRELIVMNCVLNHPTSEAAQETCARAGDPSATPPERSRWCEDHGEGWEPYEPPSK